jgi:membrane protease YdiL (CAAX protease family)
MANQDSFAPNSFQNIKARSILVWGLISLPVLILISFLLARIARLTHINPKDPIFELIISFIWVYGLIVSWTWRQFNHFKINLRRIIGTVPPNHRWLPTIGLMICVLVLSLGSFYFVYYFVSFIAPSYVKSILNSKVFSLDSKTSVPILYNTLTVITLVVVAPVTEELLFRGILLHRWTVKWGVRRAVLISSLVFAVLHGNIVGLFIFGLVMAVLYIKTGTLLVPIACHALNNGFVAVMALIAMNQGSAKTVHTIEQFRANVWAGLVFIALSAPWVIRFLYKNWPSQGWQAPYFTASRSEQE